MTTYDGAYSNRNYESAPQPKTSQKFMIVSSKFIDSYHYHGSWFEYTWELDLIDTQGNKLKKRLDTWEDYKKYQLTGVEIEYDGQTFKIVE